MKNIVLKSIVNVMLLIVLIGMKGEVYAAGQFVENNKDSIVQVVLTYATEDGTRHILQSGSGIVINSNTVLTSYNRVHMNDSNLQKAKKLVGANEENEFSIDAISVAIVKKDDILIYADIAQESEENGFAILTLQETTDRSPAILGSSSMVVMAENVMAMGYPTTKPFSEEGAQLFATSDVNLISGVVSEIQDNSIKVSGVISAGNSGGALVNANTGEVIGLLLYNKDDASKECFKVLPIDSIKTPYLDGTTYSDNSLAATTEEITTEEVVEEQVDKTLLSQSIEKALKLSQSSYTSESYLIMISCLQQAQEIQYNEDASQAEVDDAQELLQQSMDGLVAVKTVNWTLIIGIIVGIVVLIIIVVLVIVIVNLKKREKEKNEFRVVSNDEMARYEQSNMNYSAMQQTAASQVPMSAGTNQETTVLNMAGMNNNNNATTVLNVSAPQINAYLIRQKTGDRKLIDAIEYTVGKDETTVNYCIHDNVTISRCHMKIIKRGVQYYIMDLGSTNHTYLNGVMLSANQEKELKSRDMIKISDEEFIFEII